MRTARTIQIAAPAEEVFAYIADISRHPEWAGNPLEITTPPQAPLGVGSTWQSTGRLLGVHVDRVIVTEFERDRRLAFVAEGDAGRWRTTFTLEADGATTALRREMRSLQLTWFSRALSPLIPIGNGSELAKNLKAIKGVLEAGRTASRAG